MSRKGKPEGKSIQVKATIPDDLVDLYERIDGAKNKGGTLVALASYGVILERLDLQRLPNPKNDEPKAEEKSSVSITNGGGFS